MPGPQSNGEATVDSRTSLWGAFDAAAGAGGHLVEPVQGARMPLADLLERAEGLAGAIRASAGEVRRVGIFMANGEQWLRSFFAAVRLGAAAVPLPLPVGFAATAFVEYVRRIARDAELDVILLDQAVPRIASRLMSDLDDVQVIDAGELSATTAGLPGSARSIESLAVVQYTSGSTSAPKGVALTDGNVLAGLEGVVADCSWTRMDSMGSWLPLFHDMGLFSLLASLSRGSNAYLWRPGDYARDPVEWLTSFAASGATALPAPNFFYQRLAQMPPAQTLDLSHWRIAYNGAEPVRADTLRRFHEVYQDHGLPETTMTPVYGMAEATLAVSYSDVGGYPHTLTVDRRSLADGQAVETSVSADGARTLVSVGAAVSGIELRIGPQHLDGVVGEIEITGRSVMGGYLNLPAADQPLTDDGWLRTGDLGVRVDGRLYIVGRTKNVAVVNGRNVYLEDIEGLVEAGLAGVGRAAATVRGEDTEEIVVLVEMRDGRRAQETVAGQVTALVRTQIGVSGIRVVAVAPRTIPVTTSGKIQRSGVRSLTAAVLAGPAA